MPRPAVTVLTCTFNRKHTLGRLHRSLDERTFRGFEWLIVDDVSTDRTGGFVRAFQPAALLLFVKDRIELWRGARIAARVKTRTPRWGR